MNKGFDASAQGRGMAKMQSSDEYNSAILLRWTIVICLCESGLHPGVRNLLVCRWEGSWIVQTQRASVNSMVCQHHPVSWLNEVAALLRQWLEDHLQSRPCHNEPHGIVSLAPPIKFSCIRFSPLNVIWYIGYASCSYPKIIECPKSLTS